MHCFNLTAPYAVLTKLVALRLECVHYRLNWAGRYITICRDILSTLARAFGKRFWPAQS